VSTGAVDRFVANLGAVAQFKPDVLDKFDQDAWADKYADMLGVDPEMIIGNERVAVIRQNRAQELQAAQQMAMVQQGAETAKTLSGASTGAGGQNALTDIMAGLQGYTGG